MAKIEVLFWAALVLSILSFLLFAYQVVMQVLRTRPAAPAHVGGAGGATPQAFDISETLKQMGDLAHSFAKAGPISTTAVICIVFALIALISSGVVKIEGG
jgi:hypothetical protein